MRVVIAGSRKLSLNTDEINQIVKDSRFTITELVSGHATGIDIRGEIWAKHMGIPMKLYPADWETHGKAAGAIRNSLMAMYADAFIVVWDGISKGSLDMMMKAERMRKPLFVANMGEEPFNPVGIGMKIEQHVMF